MSFSLEILLVSLVTVSIGKIPLSKLQDNSIIQKSNLLFVVSQYSALIQCVTMKVSEMNYVTSRMPLKAVVFRKALSKRKAAHNNKNDNNNSELIESVCILRIGPASHRLKRILHSNNIKVYHSSHQKIHQILYSRKDKTNANLKPDAHRILCECSVVYIGETGRNLIIRQKEHFDCCIKENCENSTIAKQTWMCDHKVNWDMSAFLAPINKYFERKTGESIEIAKHWTMPQEGKPFKTIWTYLFNRS